MAYLCISIGGLGQLTGASVSTPTDCAAGNYIAVASDGYTAAPTLVDLFTIPVADDLQQAFMIGFALPVICYLTAWGYQTVIGWFSTHKGEHY